MKKRFFSILAPAVGLVSGFLLSKYFTNKSINEKESKINKFKSYYNILNLWLIAKNEKKSINNYFADYGYENIAVYGMGELGNRILEELEDSTINVIYGIDSMPTNTSSAVPVYNYTDDLPEVDAVVVTTVFVFDNIKSKLENKLSCPIISLEEIVKSLV
jgi:hypothetical protein